MIEAMAALEPAFFLGLGVVAIWIHLRYPKLRPATLTRAVLHVGLSFGLFSLVPYGVGLCSRTLPEALALPIVICGMLVPTLGYVLLSWIWLMAKIHDLGNSLPRGGHRVRPAES
jgi:hypothetical protein